MISRDDACEMPDYNPPNDEIKEILKNSKIIAMVGASDNPERDSHRVMKYLLGAGYDVIPVTPGKTEILGRKAYPSLAEIPKEIEIDIVDIFRKPSALEEVVDAALKRGTKVIWMQLGLANNKAAQKARSQGVKVIMNKCLKIEHSKGEV
ncbi:MAG: CoA-binding protein [Myxococcota bacterium]